MARISTAPHDERAGYIRVLEELAFADVADVDPVLQAVLRGEGSVVTVLPGSKQVMLAGLKGQALQALEVLSLVDVPGETALVREIPLDHVHPIGMVSLLDRITTAQSKAGAGLTGTVLANPEGRSVLVVAPDLEMLAWEDLIGRFDRSEGLYTIHYIPRRFGLPEVRDLVERVLSEGAGSGEQRPKIVSDELTGTLIVTATASQHAQIERLLERLDATDARAREELRSIPIRHRQVSEVLELLQTLLGDAEGPPNGPDEGVPTGDEPTETMPTRIPLERLTLTADEATNRILALGAPRWLDRLERVVGDIDVQHPQVLVEVLVAALTESETRDVGVELQKLAQSDDARIQLASLFGLGSADPTAVDLPAAAGTGFSGSVLDPGSYSAIVRALETVNDGKTLSVSRTLVTNNEDAVLNSVLQTPYTTTNVADAVAITSFGGTLSAGTEVSLRPQIANGDRLILDYTVSLSSFIGEAVDPAVPPPKQENLVQSVATIPDGHTVVVGGLRIGTEAEATSRVPVLGHLPLFGALFESQSESTSETTFYVFLRCTVLRHRAMEDLKYLSAGDLESVGLGDDWPTLAPRVIR